MACRRDIDAFGVHVRMRRSGIFPDGYAAMDIHPFETDLVLLALLRRADELVDKIRPASGEDAEENPMLARQRQLYRNQVLVGEATDFSPFQLGCMAALTPPLSGRSSLVVILTSASQTGAPA